MQTLLGAVAFWGVAFGQYNGGGDGKVDGQVLLKGGANKTLWTYLENSVTGPAHWHTLDPAWAICSTGLQQSPIDIVPESAVAGTNVPIQFSYSPSRIETLNNGHTLEFRGFAGNSITIGTRTYNLVNIHYHTTSEHTIRGGSFQAEAHFVHADTNGNLAVVGVMIKEGAANAAFPNVDRFKQIFPDAAGVSYKLQMDLNLMQLLPQTRTYYHYMGSLTVPPCSENVAWHVLTEPITMSAMQLQALVAMLDVEYASETGTSNRPTLPLGTRTLYLGGPPGGLPTFPATTPSASPEPKVTIGNVSLSLSEPTYDYGTGSIGIPNWGSVASLCATGMRQSPINIEKTVPGVYTPIQMSYSTGIPIYVQNDGITIKFTTEGAGSMTVGPSTYNLLQWHMHSRSEHLFSGGSFPLEIHFVHQNSTGTLAVLGIMVTEGAENPALPDARTLKQIIPNSKGVIHKLPIDLDIMPLFPKDRTFYHYKGSLTTPPCWEGVQWHVFQQPITMSKGQINALLSIMQSLAHAGPDGETNRPVLPLHGRNVYVGYPLTEDGDVVVPMPIVEVKGTVELTADAGKTKYDYGMKGPSVWHTLSPDWAICASGREQSPIDIVQSEAVMGKSSPIELRYSPVPFKVLNTGTTILFDFSSANNTAVLDGRVFKLLQLHFHSTSEHTFNGGSFPAEVHFVHADAAGNLAVLGVMFQEGEENPSFPSASRLAQIMPDDIGVTYAIPDLMDLLHLFPASRQYYHYNGSLTTPPCSEKVLWHVFSQPITLSRDQLRVLVSQMENVQEAGPNGETNRPVLPLHGRTVYIGHPPNGLPVYTPAPAPAGYGTSPASISGDLELEAPSTSVKWDYSAPEMWHTLSANWAICQSGMEQSPIDINIKNVLAGVQSPIEMSYSTTPVNVKNSGKTLEFQNLLHNSIKIRGVTYKMINIHFHHTSEHLFTGGSFPAEIHFVHMDDSGNLAVLGVMVKEGAMNLGFSADIRQFAQMFPDTTGVHHSFSSNLTIDITKLFPKNKAYYHYMGSLTTPPCSEKVRWHVFTDPITMSPDQMTVLLKALQGLEFASKFGATNRPVQPIGARTVTLGYPTSGIPDNAQGLDTRVSFPFDYFSLSIESQTMFMKDFVTQMATVLQLPEQNVTITNIQKGSTIVSARVFTAADRAEEIGKTLSTPETIFTTSNGWNTASYGEASVPPSQPATDDDDDKLSVSEIAVIVVVCLVVPALAFANIALCFYCQSSKKEAAGEGSEKKEISAINV